MDEGETGCLFDAIDAFLCGRRSEARAQGCRSFWDTRSSISRDEIEMLIDLSRQAHCAEAIASRLARDAASTQELLDALEAIGLVERCGAQYRATTATALYCWSLLENPPAD
jgi:predicted transcriptional regulator